MNLETGKFENIAIISLKDNFTAKNASQVSKAIAQAHAQGKTKIIVNMSEVNDMDTSALSTLVMGLHRSREAKGDLVLCGLKQPVRIMLELTHIDRLFEIYINEEDALRVIAETMPS